MADGLQMAHIRPPCSHYWYIGTFPTMISRLASQKGWNQCYMSVFRMWLLASCCYLVQIVYQPQVSEGVHRDGSCWTPQFQLGLWVLTAGRWRPLCLQHWSHAQWFSSIWTSWETTGWQVICSRHWWEASCNLLATDISNQLLIYWDKSLGPWWDKYLNMNVDCVNVWRVPSATRCLV
jgi:hypothetical protein